MSPSSKNLDVGQFATIIAHEIKNPLAGVGGVLEVIAMRMPHDSDERRIMNKARTRLFELDATLADLLVLTRPQEVIDTEISLKELLAAPLDLHTSKPQGTFELQGDDTLVLRGDQNLLQWMMQRLFVALHNQQPQPSVTVQSSRKPTCRLTFVGVPLPPNPETLNAAFDPIIALKAKGPGLILPAARRVAELHGGTLDWQIHDARTDLHLVFPEERVVA